MCIRIGSIILPSWQSVSSEYGYTDTFIISISIHDGLPPRDYAAAIKKMAPPIKHLRHSASIWVQIIETNGRWYAEEIRRTLVGMCVPFVVTVGADTPLQLTGFSFTPWMDNLPSPRPPYAECSILNDLTKRELACLRVLGRIESGTTIEIASLMMVSQPTARKALNLLKKRSLIWLDNNECYPTWKIKRKGLSLALRSWWMPPGLSFLARRERYGRRKQRVKELPDTKAISKRRPSNQGRHRRTSRLWLTWLRHAWPQADVWAGWSEVAFGRCRPDGLAWGELDGCETLFWLEVESGHRSGKAIYTKTFNRINRALHHAYAHRVRLVFAILAPNWVRKSLIRSLSNHDVPDAIAIVMSDWKDCGFLPIPEWGIIRNDLGRGKAMKKHTVRFKREVDFSIERVIGKGKNPKILNSWEESNIRARGGHHHEDNGIVDM